MSMWNLLLTIVLIYAQLTNTLRVTTNPSSPVEIAVFGDSTYFTLETCSHAKVELHSVTSTYPTYAIYIKKTEGWLSSYYEFTTSIQYTEADGDVVNVSEAWTEFQICNTTGSFWVSWVGGLKFGEGTLGSNVALEILSFNQQVEHLTISSDAVADWYFPEVTTTTTQMVTRTEASSVQVTTETNTEAAKDSETELETDINVHTNSSETERKTDFGSKSSAPESFSKMRMSNVLTLCSFAVVINLG